MPRKKRIWYPGAVYHIMCRGNHRQEIFRDEDRLITTEKILGCFSPFFRTLDVALRKGLSVEDVAEITGLSREAVAAVHRHLKPVLAQLNFFLEHR